jgi:tetratricopeptide (TPR) repeat protein
MKFLHLTFIPFLTTLLLLPTNNAFSLPSTRERSPSLLLTNNPSTTQVANSPSSSPKLTGLPAEIDAIAQQITVRIDSKNHGNGSGVIMARQGQTYYILTNDHVVENPDEYTVVTPDGQRYPIKAQDIVRGDGLDVAILKFTSTKNYQIATLAQYNLSESEFHLIFLSGFPASSQGKRQLSPGFRFSRERGFFEAKGSASQLSNGYELVYSNLSLPGMSGGALLDLKGQVIGINGRPEGEEYSSKIDRYLGYVFGVPIATGLGLATKAGIKPEWMKIETTKPPIISDLQRREIREQLAVTPEKPSPDADENYWLNYGNQLWRLGEFNEALASLEQAIEKNPEFYQAYYVKGLVQQSQEYYEGAVAAFERVNQINPYYYQAWRQKSDALTVLNKDLEALTAIDKAIAFNSEQANEDNPKDFMLYVSKGNILRLLKRYQEAEAAYTEAIKIKPSYLAYVNRGNVRDELKRYPEAIADYERAIKINPQYAVAYNNRGLVRYALKHYPEAIADYERAIKINPQYAGAYGNRGNVRDALKHYPEALADYNQVIKINPLDALAYNNRGLVRYALKQYPEALADYNRAIKLDPFYPEALKNRGIVRYELKDYRGAIDDLQSATKLFELGGNLEASQLAQQKLREVESSPR